MGMYRTKVLFGILSTAAALLYAGFGLLSLSNDNLSRLDQIMPIALCATHLLAGAYLFISAYHEYHKEHLVLLKQLQMLVKHQGSFSVEDFARLTGLSLAETQDFLLRPSVQRLVLSLGHHEKVVQRAIPRHYLN